MSSPSPKFVHCLRAASPLLALGAALLLGTPARGGDTPPAGQPPDKAADASGAKPGDKPADKPGGAGGDGGAKPKAASMVIEETSNTPDLPPPPPQGEEKKLIGEYIVSHTDDVRDCYQKRLVERPTLQGKLIARFDIGPSGRVIGATAEGLGDARLVACVVGAVRKWEFEKPQSGGKLRIAFPFKLTPEVGQR